MSMRIKVHPILGEDITEELINIQYDGRWIKAKKGEMVLSALLAEGIIINRFTERYKEPRGLFCGIGLCTDCSMVVNGRPNVRTCITPVAEGMIVHTQFGNRDERITENGK